MTIMTFIGIAVGLFIVGVLFILKGIPDEESKAVPIKSLGEIRELKEAYVPSTPSEPKAVPSLDAEQKVQSQPNQSMDENHQLRKEILESKTEYDKLKRHTEDIEQEHSRFKEEQERSMKALVGENAKYRAENEQSASNEKLLDNLKSKIEILEKQHQDSQSSQGQMKATVEQLKLEKDNLLTQVQLKNQEDTAALKAQIAATNKSDFEILSNKLINAIATIEEVKRENKDLKDAKQKLIEDFKQTEELSEHLVKKEKMMQYELTKNRAQALGLERICADFRTKIETMAGAASG